MKSLVGFFMTRLWAPFHARLIKIIAYGPWGPLHQIFIIIFKSLYKIQYPTTIKFKTLGDFFLRPIEIRVELDPRPTRLVSPAESRLIDGPTLIQLQQHVSIKGLEYVWSDFKEIEIKKFSKGMYWNFYLAPYHYHWVHSPCAGTKLQGIRISGLQYPVNSLGRWLCPSLYSKNERLTFRFQSPVYGEVILFCVGAVGVSALHSALGEVPYDRWVDLKDSVDLAEQLLAFRLGSTVLMLVENAPPSPLSKTHIQVAEAL
jgi:phosphatidylserine decarboxylase